MLNAAEIAGLVEALKPRIDGGRLTRVRQPDGLTLVLEIVSSQLATRQTTYLVLSAHPQAARLAEASQAGPTLPAPDTLGAFLRAAGQDRRVSLEVIPGERVVVLSLGGGRLYAELLDRAANLIAVGPDERVAAAARPVRPGLKLGQPYAPLPARPQPDTRPPRAEFLAPLAVEQAAQIRLAALAEQAEADARRRALTEARNRLSRLINHLERDAAQAGDPEPLYQRGELLKANLHRVKKGQTQLAVVDYFDPELCIALIELSPALDAAGNLAQLFARYRRARASKDQVTQRLAEARAQVEQVEALAEQPLTALELVDALRALRLVRGPVKVGGRVKVEPRRPYLRFVSRAGELILVGRGGSDNHTTTFHIAKGNDHWLHVRDAPGAHVIVPLPKRGQEPHPETLLDAAALAAHHSDLRGEPVVDVSHTRRKHVRAVPGGPPGRVSLADARALTVSDVLTRIPRLYEEKPSEI